MDIPLSILLCTFIVSPLQFTAVVAESPRQGLETNGDIGHRVFRRSRLTDEEDGDVVLKDLLQVASAHRKQSHGIGNRWKEEAKRSNDEDKKGWYREYSVPDTDEKIRAGLSGSWNGMEKRIFDSLGGGLIPVRRRQYDWKRKFDSLGGGIIPQQSRAAVKDQHFSAMNGYVARPSVGVKARRRFDSLGGGLIPPSKVQSSMNKVTSKIGYLYNYITGAIDHRKFDSLGGGLIPPRKRRSSMNKATSMISYLHHRR